MQKTIKNDISDDLMNSIVGVRITEAEKKKLKEICTEKGVSMSDILRETIGKTIEGEKNAS